jgi:hypothetical protein
VERALGILIAGDGGEPAKPSYRLTWPPTVDELAPDLGSPDLPVQLPRILRDLDSIRTSLAAAGAELAVSSFVWLVHDGMQLDPRRHSQIVNVLRKGWGAYRYRDLRRLADFQNRVLRRYAEEHGLVFVDQAGAFPVDPTFFKDPIHFTREGVRVQGWIAFNALVPPIRARIASGVWPRRDRFKIASHPGIAPARQVAGCRGR